MRIHFGLQLHEQWASFNLHAYATVGKFYAFDHQYECKGLDHLKGNFCEFFPWTSTKWKHIPSLSANVITLSHGIVTTKLSCCAPNIIHCICFSDNEYSA